jgi:hypothetical protein
VLGSAGKILVFRDQVGFDSWGYFCGSCSDSGFVRYILEIICEFQPDSCNSGFANLKWESNPESQGQKLPNESNPESLGVGVVPPLLLILKKIRTNPNSNQNPKNQKKIPHFLLV